MSFHNLRRLEHRSINETTIPGIAHLPTSILDALIPGYSFISRYLLDAFGFDISIIVSVLVLSFACTTGVHYIYRHLRASFLTYFTASVVIDAYDGIYDNLMSWAAEQEDLKRVRYLKVQSADYTDDLDELQGDADGDDCAIFNFNSWAAKVPPRYEPDTGYHWFRHKGHWFKFSREHKKIQEGWMGMMIREQETVQLTVIGRSTTPIKELILDTRDRNLSKHIAKTKIRRPSPKEQRGRGRQAWIKVAVRPVRPMGTVVLDAQQKAAILRDINDFLDPAATRWYSNRGISHRRGYLLSGPMGTGKTSLSFALAGVFGLDIYCLSLSERTLSEEDLILLFNSLPKRCIVLLEDIDSAGVARKREDTAQRGEEKPKSRKENVQSASAGGENGEAEATASLIAKEVAKAVKTASESADRPFDGRPGSANEIGITLSGLLNAIDGVASQEGRVLIMTTNYPEKLDDALVRPGRVDMRIEFTLASKQQIRELFLRMYCADSREVARVPTNLKQIMPDILEVSLPASSPSISEKNDKDKQDAFQRPVKPSPPTPPQTPIITAPSRSLSVGRASSKLGSVFSSQAQPLADLETLADAFADILPGATFSPAEVQGYLIMRKNDPWTAVAEVAAWRDAELAKKSVRLKDADTNTQGDGKTQDIKVVDHVSKPSSTKTPTETEREEADESGRGDCGNTNGDVMTDSHEDQDGSRSRLPVSGSTALTGNKESAVEENSDECDSGSEDSQPATDSGTSSPCLVGSDDGYDEYDEHDD